jgi:hypothetical protein
MVERVFASKPQRIKRKLSNTALRLEGSPGSVRG